MLTVPDHLISRAREVGAKRLELAAAYERLCRLNDELRACGGVAFTEPKSDGFCVSYRANRGHSPAGRGFCAPEDRERTTPLGVQVASAELTERIESAHTEWQVAAGGAEQALFRFEAEGRVFLEEVLVKAAPVADGRVKGGA
jgi:hypothetical protein